MVSEELVAIFSFKKQRSLFSDEDEEGKDTQAHFAK